jgi:hypothetical protein
MEDSRWLRLVTIGLVLMALAVGYFLLSGKLFSNSTTKLQSQTNKAVSSPSPTASPSATPASAYTRIAERSQGSVQTLPNTGFPVFLVSALSASVMIVGWGLKKFPH